MGNDAEITKPDPAPGQQIMQGAITEVAQLKDKRFRPACPLREDDRKPGCLLALRQLGKPADQSYGVGGIVLPVRIHHQYRIAGKFIGDMAQPHRNRPLMAQVLFEL